MRVAFWRGSALANSINHPPSITWGDLGRRQWEAWQGQGKGQSTLVICGLLRTETPHLGSVWARFQVGGSHVVVCDGVLLI